MSELTDWGFTIDELKKIDNEHDNNVYEANLFINKHLTKKEQKMFNDLLCYTEWVAGSNFVFTFHKGVYRVYRVSDIANTKEQFHVAIVNAIMNATMCFSRQELKKGSENVYVNIYPFDDEGFLTPKDLMNPKRGGMCFFKCYLRKLEGK